MAVASTGVIGVPLPMERGHARDRRAPRGALCADGDVDFAEAIRTTDAFAKRASLDVALPAGTVRLSAQAKGAGMISPGFATLLCFVQTDAALSPETADLLLGVTVKRSFERDQRRRPAVDQRHRDPAVQRRVRASRSSPRPRTSSASARRSTRCCASSR